LDGAIQKRIKRVHCHPQDIPHCLRKWWCDEPSNCWGYWDTPFSRQTHLGVDHDLSWPLHGDHLRATSMGFTTLHWFTVRPLGPTPCESHFCLGRQQLPHGHRGWTWDKDLRSDAKKSGVQCCTIQFCSLNMFENVWDVLSGGCLGTT
jgi:hypothetical protein